jgi:hypothetical protein
VLNKPAICSHFGSSGTQSANPPEPINPEGLAFPKTRLDVPENKCHFLSNKGIAGKYRYVRFYTQQQLSYDILIL